MDPDARIRNLLRHLARQGIDILLPPRCLGCGARVADPNSLCAQCWRGLSFIAAPYCQCCGLPFAHDVGPNALCAGCMAEPPPFARARAVVAYDDASRPLLLGFKHGDRTDAAPAYGRWMARAGQALVAESDFLVPAPMHWTRLVKRKYNQSALLARVIGKESGVPVATGLLTRHRRTPALGGLGREARQRAVQGSMRVRKRGRERLRGSRVTLVDDVLTSGATAVAATSVLLRAGARAVDVLVLARVVRAE